METIAKFIKAFFLGADGEVDVTTLLKFKRCLLWVVLGSCLTFGALLLWVDSEESDKPATAADADYWELDENGDTILYYYE